MRRLADKWVAVCTALCILCAVVTAVVGSTVIDYNAQTAELEAQADRIERVAEGNRQAVHDLAALQKRFVAESRKRRDQSCRSDEREHKRDVKGLRDTYRYLDRVADTPSSQRDEVLIEAVLRNLPNVEREARKDTAPPFCDEPGFGLKEPDPKLPKRRSFKHLLRP